MSWGTDFLEILLRPIKIIFQLLKLEFRKFQRIVAMHGFRFQNFCRGA